MARCAGVVRLGADASGIVGTVERTLIVGVDGSEDAKVAVNWAAEVAPALDARVVAVHAVGLLEHERGDPESSHLRPELAQWTTALDGLPAGRVERRLIPGDPVSVLLDLAASEPGAIVTIGTRGKGGRLGYTLGSTSLQVAERCPCPVVIVPRPAGSG